MNFIWVIRPYKKDLQRLKVPKILKAFALINADLAKYLFMQAEDLKTENVFVLWGNSYQSMAIVIIIMTIIIIIRLEKVQWVLVTAT